MNSQAHLFWQARRSIDTYVWRSRRFLLAGEGIRLVRAVNDDDRVILGARGHICESQVVVDNETT